MLGNTNGMLPEGTEVIVNIPEHEVRGYVRGVATGSIAVIGPLYVIELKSKDSMWPYSCIVVPKSLIEVIN